MASTVQRTTFAAVLNCRLNILSTDVAFENVLVDLWTLRLYDGDVLTFFDDSTAYAHERRGEVVPRASVLFSTLKRTVVAALAEIYSD